MENKIFKARKKIGEFTTFSEYLQKGMEIKDYTIYNLMDIFEKRNVHHTEKEIKFWIKEAKYPDISDIYILAEVLELSPNDLLEAKQNMQEAGLNAVDMLTMRVVCNLIDVSIWKLHIINNVLFWVFLVGTCGTVWGIYVPIVSDIIRFVLPI